MPTCISASSARQVAPTQAATRQAAGCALQCHLLPFGAAADRYRRIGIRQTPYRRKTRPRWQASKRLRPDGDQLRVIVCPKVLDRAGSLVSLDSFPLDLPDEP